MQKLASFSWGADAKTLKASALALVYYVAEYCCPFWFNVSNHVSEIKTALNTTIRTFSGTVKSTPCQWLPVLSNIPSPQYRRQKALVKEYCKLSSNRDLPIHKDIHNNNQNLKSRKYPCEQPVLSQNVQTTHGKSVLVLNLPAPHYFGGYWLTLNRSRAEQGRSGKTLYRWGLQNSPACDCSHPTI